MAGSVGPEPAAVVALPGMVWPVWYGAREGEGGRGSDEKGTGLGLEWGRLKR